MNKNTNYSICLITNINIFLISIKYNHLVMAIIIYIILFINSLITSISHIVKILLEIKNISNLIEK